MSVKDKLQIMIVTFNRDLYLKRTLEQLVNSPISDCEITIFDNKSSDRTKDVFLEFSSKFENLKYVKNHFNVGANANIVKAMESSTKEYYWILGDDDFYDFKDWQKVEDAINRGEKVISIFKPEVYKSDLPALIQCSTFVAANIVSSSLLNNTVITNAHYTTHTLFPHLAPIISHINHGGNIFASNSRIVYDDFEQRGESSYLRGYASDDIFYANMSWITGFALVVSNLKDKNLRADTLKFAMNYMYGGTYKCLKGLAENYKSVDDIGLLSVLAVREFKYQILSIIFKIIGIKYLLLTPLCNVMNFIFSLKKDYSHTILTIFGIKIKLKGIKDENR